MLLVRLTVYISLLVVKFLRVKVIYGFSTAQDFGAPNFYIVQGSTVYLSIYLGDLIISLSFFKVDNLYFIRFIPKCFFS